MACGNEMKRVARYDLEAYRRALDALQPNEVICPLRMFVNCFFPTSGLSLVICFIIGQVN